MAGNTKLWGFAEGGVVVLQRWGKKASVKLSPAAIDVLLEACRNELPKKPVGQFSPLQDFRAEYNESTGIIELRLSAEVAGRVASALNAALIEGASGEKELRDWATRINELVAEHEEYINTKGEPGVE